MDTLKNVTSLGYILKREELATLASKIKFAELILEDLDPFPGFYDQYFIPASEKETKPRSIFLVLKEFDVCHEDHFVRMTMHIKGAHKIAFDSALGNIMLFNKSTPCIRIQMGDYSQLPALIDHYREMGLKFRPSQQVKAFQSLIKLRKFFHLHVLEPGLYKDQEQEATWYLRMPGFLTWEEFEKATVIVRNSSDFKQYDAAQAAIYEKSGVVDLVRIYSKRISQEELRILKTRYAAEVMHH